MSTEGGSRILGDMLEINQNLSMSESSPVVVDAIRRVAYWYSPSTNRIYSQSLHSGAQEVSMKYVASDIFYVYSTYLISCLLATMWNLYKKDSGKETTSQQRTFFWTPFL